MDIRYDPFSATQEDSSYHRVIMSDNTLLLVKFIIGLYRDCELQFFEMVNFEPYCQLNRLESIPIKIVCWYISRAGSVYNVLFMCGYLSLGMILKMI